MSQFSFHVYQPADVIISESEASQRIYWILSGSCKTTKTVAFISKAIDGKKFLAPFEFGPLQEGQEIVQRRLNVHELDVGIHFPPLPACNITEWDTIFSVKRSEFISALGSRKRKGRVSDRNMSLVASTKCEVASLDVMDLAIHAPIPIILSLLRSRVEIFSPQELQSIYLENLRWNDFKKSVIKGARSDARATKYQTP